MATRSIIVFGRVQGVGFRAFVCELADEIGVQGEVWNSESGTVDIVAQHVDAATLDAFASRLRLGPGKVERVLSGDVIEGRRYSGFDVGPTR